MTVIRSTILVDFCTPEKGFAKFKLFCYMSYYYVSLGKIFNLLKVGVSFLLRLHVIKQLKIFFL